MLQIKSATATASFKTQAAEIISFKKNGIDLEYMWQGDAAYWQGRNPILFPIVSNTYSGSYEINGKTYAMGNHGLARHQDFQVISQDTSSLTMAVTSDEATLKQYPFEYHLQVCYRLDDTKLSIEYEVKNIGQGTMPFTIGLHPAFNVPLAAGEFSDYKLCFEKEELATKLNYDGSEEAWGPSQEISLDYEVFQREPTLVYKDLKSAYVRLTNNKEGLEVGIAGFPYLAFWCGKRAPFLCIEPWYSIGDFGPNTLKFAERPGMMSLAQQATFNCGYYIKLL